jgi:hypothetical protein
MDSGRKASLCHGEHIRVRRMSCRLLEGFTFSSAGLTGKGVEHYRIGRQQSRDFSTRHALDFAMLRPCNARGAILGSATGANVRWTMTARHDEAQADTGASRRAITPLRKPRYRYVRPFIREQKPTRRAENYASASSRNSSNHAFNSASDRALGSMTSASESAHFRQRSNPGTCSGCGPIRSSRAWTSARISLDRFTLPTASFSSFWRASRSARRSAAFL